MPEEIDARKMIYQKYDEKFGKGVHAEANDPDSPHYYETPEEIEAGWEEKKKKEMEDSPLTHRKEVMERIYSKDAPQPEPEAEYDYGSGADEAFAEFMEAHPDITEADWKAMNKETFILTSPDLVELREKARASGSKADVARLLERAADGYATAKQKAERKAYVEYRQSQQPHNRIDDEAMKMHKFMQKRSKV